MTYQIDWDASNNASCGGKKIFLTWKQATTHNHMMSRRGSSVRAKGKKIDRLHVYRCNTCRYFHLGHAARQKRKLRDFIIDED